MLAEYGGAEWADEQAQVQLLGCYVRRRRFEAKLLALELKELGAGAGPGGDKIPGHQLLGEAGISL